MIRSDTFIPVFCALVLFGQGAHADPPDRITEAQAFMAVLEDDERDLVIRDFDHPDRVGWSFFPVLRKGLHLRDLDDEERAALDAFLKTSLGEKGLEKVRDVIEVEPISDRGGGVRTGPGEYVIQFYGSITKDGLWAWRLEGHHIALNQMLQGDRVIASTPSFLGSAPMRSASGVEPLHREIDLATRLARGMEGEKKARVLQSMPPGEIVSGMIVEWTVPERTGITSDEMSDSERKMLLALAMEHAGTHAHDVSEAFRARWGRTPPESIHFAYFGSVDQQGGHGYRIQGPDWVMEYVNVQAGGNHVHAVWRMLEGEFTPIAAR